MGSTTVSWLRPVSILLLVLVSQWACASVVLTGTRVIYPGDAKDHSIQLRNRDSFPNVVQLWMDIDNPESTPETADAPFVLLPAIFKVPANGGQTVRMLYTAQLCHRTENLFSTLTPYRYLLPTRLTVATRCWSCCVIGTRCFIALNH